MQYGELRSDRGPGSIYGFLFVKVVSNSNVMTARKGTVQHLFQHQLIVREHMNANGETRLKTQPKIQKTNER